MAKTFKMPTDDQMQSMYQLAMLITKNVKQNLVDSKWIGKSITTIIFAVVAIAGMVGTLAYYIMTSHIAPLMIYTACAIPVLAFAMAQQGKTIEKVANEYDEYSTAISAFLTSITGAASTAIDDRTTVALAAAIVASTTVVADKVDTVTFGELSRLPQYKNAANLANSLVMIQKAIDKMTEEGYDIDEILKTIDLDSYLSMDEFYQYSTSMLKEMKLLDESKYQDTEKAEESEVSENDSESEPASADEKSDAHIISVKDDDSVEDLTLVV